MDIKDIPGALERIERRLTDAEGWSSAGIKRLCEVEKQTHILETELLRHSKSIDKLTADIIHGLADVVASNYGQLEARIADLQEWRRLLDARQQGQNHQIADLQQRVGELEQHAIRQAAQVIGESREAHIEAILQAVRQAPVDDHRDAERPAQMMACPGDGCPSCNACKIHQPHAFSAGCCDYPCRKMTGLFRCQPVPAQEPKPAPEMVQCGNSECVFAYPQCTHRGPHEHHLSCDHSTCIGKGTCVPVPASPVAAIPDVPVPVVTEAFRETLMGHTRELSEAYGYLAAAPDASAIDAESWEHLAGVACVLRDAYELARTGEQEQAEEKLREIEW